MSTQQESTGFCKSCHKQTLLRRKGTNHILHLLLTIFTCGLWFIIWMLSSIKIGGWRCTLCGMKTKRSWEAWDNLKLVVGIIGLIFAISIIRGFTTTASKKSEIKTEAAGEKIKSPLVVSTVKTNEIRNLQKPTDPEWGIVNHFGLVTTIWVSKDTLNDKNMLAQILHTIETKYGRGIVWFFDSPNHTPTGVPMTDKQMLHWVGLYDPSQADTFSYVEITNPNSSPPDIRTVKTSIRPGYAE